MKEVLAILNEKLIEKISGNEPLKVSLSKWFIYLSDVSRFDGNRFLFCLAIDLKYDLLEVEHLIKIFDSLDFTRPEEKILADFDVKLHKEATTYFQHSNCADCDYSKDKYVCVRPWTKLFDKIKVYKTATGKYTIMDFDDEDHVRYRLFEEYSLDLADVKEWAGWKYLTWLLSHKEFIELKEKHTDEIESLNYVMDSLGLEPPAKNTASGEFDFYVYIEYPDDFEIDSYQPTTLCGYWKEDGGLYLSFKKSDGYGRTFSTTGSKNTAKERVINSTDYGNENFIPSILGKSDGTLTKDRTNILNEALNRLLYA